MGRRHRPAPGPAGTVAPSASPATAACTLEHLPLPAGATSGAVLAGSPNGRHLVGSFQRPGIANLPAWWQEGRLRSVPVEADAIARDVNDNGVVVGSATGSNGQDAPWAYVDGKLVWLPVPAGYTGGTAQGINARGEVAGTLFGRPERAVVWRDLAGSVRMEVLPAPADGAFATGIADSGVVIGGLHKAGLPYRWDVEGRGSVLPLPAGTDLGSVHGIRGRWAQGTGSKSNGAPALGTGAPMPVLWDLETGTATIVGSDHPGAVNVHGLLVLNRREGEVLLRDPDGNQRKLPGAEGWRYQGGTVNDDGTQIAGMGGALPVRWLCPR
ncbi:hypothetical protein [Plantactinospora veratri]